MCLDIECEVEYIYHNQSCSLVHQMVNENNYEINLIAFVNNNKIHPTNLSSQSILDAFQVFLRRKNLKKYLCRISILGSVDVLYIAMVIELSISKLHNIDQMLKYLLNIFSSFNLNNIPQYIPFNTFIDISFSLVGQSFHVYGSNLFHKVIEKRCYVHPGSGKEMVLYNNLNALNQEHDERKNCLRGQMMSIVADWYRCPKVKIRTSDARMDISNFSVCLLDYGKCFASIYFKQSLDKRSVSICLEQYLQSIKVIKSSFISSNDSLMSYFSLLSFPFIIRFIGNNNCFSFERIMQSYCRCKYHNSCNVHKFCKYNIHLIKVFSLESDIVHWDWYVGTFQLAICRLLDEFMFFPSFSSIYVFPRFGI